MFRYFSFILLTSLFCITNTPAKSQIREDILQRAYKYSTHIWTATSNNIWYPILCGGKTVETPSWVVLGINTSVPYCWGGYMSTAEFDTGVTAYKSAGDANTQSSYGAPSCASGVDCSGFLSQAWDCGRYTTSSFPSISTQLGSYQDLEPTDIVNKPSSHVRMVYELNPNGSVTMIEAATGNALVGGKGLYRVFTWTYSLTDLAGMEGEGYIPRRYNNFATGIENEDCVSAISIISSTQEKKTASTVSGAEASTISIPNCNGWVSPSALDVWFSFTAESSSHTLTVYPNGDLDAVVALYEGCSSGQLIDCADVSGGPGLVTPITYDGFIKGNTYYVRVFDYGIASKQPSNGKFDISVTHSETLPVCNDTYEPNNTVASASHIVLKDNAFSSTQACIGGADAADVYFLDIPDGEYLLSVVLTGADVPYQVNTGGMLVTDPESSIFVASGGVYILFQEANTTLSHYTFSLNLTAFVPSETAEYTVENGNYSVTGNLDEEGYVKLVAEPDQGAVFLYWEINGDVGSKSSVLVQDHKPRNTYLAVFAKESEAIIVSANTEGGCGETSGGGFYMPGTSVTLTALGSDNCRFKNFSINGNIVGLDTEYTFTPQANTEVVATFSPVTVGTETPQSDLYIFPNPADDRICISRPELVTGKTWHIYSISGIEVLRGVIAESSDCIDILQLAKGEYIIRFDSLNEQWVFTK